MNDVIIKRRSEKIIEKQSIWDLILDSYVGGQQYRDGGHLIRYYRESVVSYNSRIERATYINHVQPLSDILTGFILKEQPYRKIPSYLNYLLNDASHGRSYDEVIQSVITQAMLYPIFMLIDTPIFDKDIIKTKADRINNNINPYITIYNYKEIRDFSLNDRGEVEWILLDNTYIDKSNPFNEPQTIKVYRLWTSTYFKDFQFEIENDGKANIIEGPEIEHKIGRIPGAFVGLKTLNDHPDSTTFESISLLSKSVYNLLSLLDEVIYGHSFSTLFFPVQPGEDLPEVIKEQGVGALVVIPFNGQLSQTPFYANAGAIAIEPFIDTFKLYTKEIFRQVGFTVSEDDNRFWSESGVAKSVEFQKTEALLRLIVTQIQKAETIILQSAAAWEGIYDATIEVKYSKDFENSAIEEELNNLYKIYTLPIQSIQKAAMSRIVNKTFDDLTPEEEKLIQNDIENTELNVQKIEVKEEVIEKEEEVEETQETQEVQKAQEISEVK